MPRTVSAADANRQFSEILGQAADGNVVTITRRGTPVAQLIPYHRPVDAGDEARAWSRLLAMLKRGAGSGIDRFDRDALYEDRCGR